MAEFKDITEEFKNAKPAEKMLLIGSLVAVAGIGLYVYFQNKAQQAATQTYTAPPVPTGATNQASVPGFPTLTGGQIPILPPGYNVLYDANGSVVAYQPSTTPAPAQVTCGPNQTQLGNVCLDNPAAPQTPQQQCAANGGNWMGFGSFGSCSYQNLPNSSSFFAHGLYGGYGGSDVKNPNPWGNPKAVVAGGNGRHGAKPPVATMVPKRQIRSTGGVLGKTYGR